MHQGESYLTSFSRLRRQGCNSQPHHPSLTHVVHAIHCTDELPASYTLKPAFPPIRPKTNKYPQFTLPASGACGRYTWPCITNRCRSVLHPCQ